MKTCIAVRIGSATAALVALYFLLFACMSLLQIKPLDAAPTYINDSIITKVNVTNYRPRVVDVVVDDLDPAPADEMDLVSGGTIRVWCNGTVIDRNGKDDIIAVNATIYFTANKTTEQDDRNEHYTNSSCAVIEQGDYNATYSCTFAVWFFANNGTWYCNMSAWDSGDPTQGTGPEHNSSTDDTYINQLYALDVPPVVDFGELELSTTSVNTNINITNTGNMDLDLELYAYGGTTEQENNLSMICTTGNITVTNLRFDLVPGDDLWNGMNQMSGQFANPYQETGLDLAQRTDEALNSTSESDWKIRTPDYDAKGVCNGTIVFNAIEEQ
jgi:hypothetical protein